MNLIFNIFDTEIITCSKGLLTFKIIIMKNDDSNAIEAYIKSFPQATQEKLQQVRAIIMDNAQDSEEYISYAMPSYKLRGKPLVYFAGYKNHIGFYALPSGHEFFKKEFSIYKTGKGSVQFPLDKDLPAGLIASVVQFRVKEVTEGLAK